jgi:hypothetical protein
MGWSDSKTPLTVYGDAMRRDDGENERLRALVEGADLEGLGTSAQSNPDDSKVAEQSMEAASRS